MTTDLSGAKIIQSQTIEGKYPDYKSIVPKINGSYTKVIINPLLLKKVAVFLADFVEKPQEGIEMFVPKDPNKPLTFEGKRNKQNAKIIVMPIKQ